MEKIKNPIKQAAVDLAHMMNTNERQWEMNEFERDLWRREYNQFLTDLAKKGYGVDRLLHLADEYKTLSMSRYMEWIYE